MPIQTNGYIYIYVANETMDDVNVHFDDIEVTLIESPANHASDYYPFGLVMDGRSWSSEPYRFGYQGQFSEYDEETGWNAFELRMYDSKIGRWLSPDPAGQYHSPYLAFGNNPVSRVDPNGGTDGDFGEGCNCIDVQPGPSSHLNIQTGAIWTDLIGGGQLYFDLGNTYLSESIDFNPDGGEVRISNLDTDLIGMMDYSYNLVVNSNINATSEMKTLGFGFSFLSTSLTGYQVYNQYKKGNVNPVDVVGVTGGTIGLTSQIMTWFGYGGRVVSFLGNNSGYVGIGITSGKMWYDFVYKPINDTRFAPDYINQKGQPVYNRMSEQEFWSNFE